MASRRDLDDGSSEPDDASDTEEARPRRTRRHRRPVARHSGRTNTPVRRWRAMGGEPDDEEDEELGQDPGRKSLFHRDRRPVFWRARDSLYFEPLVAVAIIVVLLAGLFAYTQNWPPVYVVESDSMQHGTADILGVINTGDLVLAQRLPTAQITPYVTGLQTQYSTYGEYGDVLLYSANGQGSTPIIHRAILFLQWDPVAKGYNATDLLPFQASGHCGNASDAVYSTPGTRSDCALTDLTQTLDLFNLGWHSVNISIQLSPAVLGAHSGFLTMGDKNFFCLTPSDCTGLPDQGPASISTLVEPGWVVGVARGMLPWFGALKLVLAGDASMVPSQSWQFLGITIVGLILLAFAIHFAFRAEGIEDPRRKEEEDEEEEAEARGVDLDATEEGRGRRLLQSLRPWRHPDDDLGDDGESRPRKRAAPATVRAVDGHRGRPHPKVRRAEKRKKKHPGDEDL